VLGVLWCRDRTAVDFFKGVLGLSLLVLCGTKQGLIMFRDYYSSFF
jgi:hypothetical protein